MTEAKTHGVRGQGQPTYRGDGHGDDGEEGEEDQTAIEAHF